MHFVTAGNEKFATLLGISLLKLGKLGYGNYTVYDLGGLGIGEKFEIEDDFNVYPFPPCYFKPAIIQKKLSELPEGEILVYLDADAYVQERIDEIEDVDFDIGLTKREKEGKDPREGKVNAGVMFLRNCENTKLFVKTWNERTKEMKGDQIALNSMVEWERVKFFPCKVYNDKNAKICHLKDSK